MDSEVLKAKRVVKNQRLNSQPHLVFPESNNNSLKAMKSISLLAPKNESFNVDKSIDS